MNFICKTNSKIIKSKVLKFLKELIKLVLVLFKLKQYLIIKHSNLGGRKIISVQCQIYYTLA